MGRSIYGENVDFQFKYWFAKQPSELGTVLEAIEGVTVWVYRGEDGEIVVVENSDTTKEALKRAVETPEKYTMEDPEATKDMLEAILKCLNENDVEQVKFFSEY